MIAKRYGVLFMQKNSGLFIIIFAGVFCLASVVIFKIQQDSSNIYCVNTFDLLAQKAKTLDSKDLVIFDVDGVLLIEEDAIFGVKAENKALWTKLFRSEKRIPSLSSDEGRCLYSIVRQQSICVPVDEKVIQIIENLQAKNVKTIALTAIKTGRNGIIEKTEDWRFDQLKVVGIDFSTSFHLDEPLMLLPQKTYLEYSLHNVNSSVFAKKGIVFTGEYSKGDVLRSFLAAIEWWPERIIFIDDNKSLLESVANMCKDLGIQFMGLHYIGAEEVSKPIDENVAKFQVDYLFDHKKWLSDQQAKNLMQELQNK